MIKTIIFDLGGVIVPLDFKRGYEAMEAVCGCRAADIPRRIASTGLVPQFEKGQVKPEDFVAAMCDCLGLEMDFDEFCGLWASIFPPHTLIPESFLESLRARYRLLLLSNTNALHFSFIHKNYPLLRHMDHFVLSYEVGAMKPSPEIYHAALARSECSPQECLFIDDVADNVEAARREGMDAEQFHSFDQLRRDLKTRAIDA
ncbi:MAG: HAD family phosphatase [Bryobacteraceae bacterium]|nr:HAD family phosphatase [Bryobacteraceae bacterium]